MSFDMSFGDGAGWGGDTSFATETSGKDSESNRLSEKLPIPAQIPLLASLSEDKLVLGNMMFSTAYTIGDIKEVIGEPSNRQYRLVDPQDQTSTFLVTAFNGVSEDGTSNEEEGDVPVGTRVFVCGKLRSFDGIVSMFGYKVRILDSDLEYDCFVKEAEIAKIYWEKNVPSVLRCGEGDSLTGCAAGGPVPKDGAAPSYSGSSIATPSRGNSSIPASSHRPAASGPSEKKFGDVRDKETLSDSIEQVLALVKMQPMSKLVLDLLKEQARISAESGSDRKDLHIDVIARTTNSDKNKVREALDFLSQEGTIYCTVDDEHYETV